MSGWLRALRHDPLQFLMGSGSAQVVFFAKRDLLEEPTGPMRGLWTLPQARKALSRQKPDGRWEYPGGVARVRSQEDYDQLETFRQLGLLVEEFGFDRSSPAIRKTAGFLFSHQTDEGDFRGIYGRQYSPNYSAAIMELLIKAGYGDDRRIERAFRWLLSIRQSDGGWAIPFRTARSTSPRSWTDVIHSGPVQPDVSKPFSHLATGVVLRAFAAHEEYRRSPEARVAGELICTRFFKADRYVDRKAPEFWERISFPFWFTDIVSVLDSLSLMNFRREEPAIASALRWLAGRQAQDGSFDVKLLRDKDAALPYWVCLSICRVFKRFYSQN